MVAIRRKRDDQKKEKRIKGGGGGGGVSAEDELRLKRIAKYKKAEDYRTEPQNQIAKAKRVKTEQKTR